jgi:hypothetical protein
VSAGSRLTVFFASMLVAIGALIAGLCGTCTWYFLDQGHASSDSFGFLLAMIVGGIPTLFGVIAFFVGVTLLLRATDRGGPYG